MPFLIDHLLLEPIMKTIRKSLLASCLALGLTLGGTSFASADVRIHLSFFPNLVPVPGYPVYYAPGVEANFFFYDGMYWLYDDDGWYMSNWYDGPWEYVDPDDVPLFVLRVPLRYYRAPPAYFWGGYRDAAAVGTLLGPGLGEQSPRLGSLGPSPRATAGTIAGLSTWLSARSLSGSQ